MKIYSLICAVMIILSSNLWASEKVKNQGNTSVFDTGYGEKIWELAGISVGNAQKHSVAIVEISPGTASKEHFHPVVEESYYVLGGEGLLILENKEIPLVPGDLIVIPIGSKHKIINKSRELTLKLLVTCAEAWHPDCFVSTET
jgi:mannose-6-phosphate isomerase-like protein (cupin superfamily)